MEFKYNLPLWENAGIEPSAEWRRKGYEAGESPGANTFNWFLSTFTGAVGELQDKLHSTESMIKKTYSVGTTEELDNALNTVLASMEQHSLMEFEVSFTAAIQPLGGGTFLCKMYKVSDKYSLVEMRVYATTSPKTWTRSLFEGVWKDWVYLINSAEYSALQTLVDGKWDRLAAYKEDADTTLNPVILTNTGTLPTDEFWYIHTTFFGTVSETSARKQVAYGYTQNKIYTRRYFEGAWSEWTVVYTGNNKPTYTDVGASPDGLIVNKYTVKSESEIDNAIKTVYASMADNSSRFITMFVDTSGLSLVGGGWHFILNRTTATYGTLFGMCYGHNSMKMRFLKNGELQAWQTIYTGRPTPSDIGAAKIYVNVATLGLSPSTATPLEIFNKMDDNSIGLFAVGTDWNADAVPTQYGTLFVARRTTSRAFFLFEGIGGTYQTWMGTLNTTDGVSFSGWRMLYDTTNKPSKSDVGLGNVPDVATNDQTPTYSDTTTLATLSSGEKLNVAFQKIKCAITNLINHLNNKSNPHGVTASQVGAAASTHTHGAAQITSGVFSATNIKAKAGTDYTYERIRNESLNSADTTPSENGAIAWTYE